MIYYIYKIKKDKTCTTGEKKRRKNKMLKMRTNFNLEGLTIENTYLEGFNWLDSELTSNNDYMLELDKMFADNDSEPATEKQIQAFLEMCNKRGVKYNGTLKGITKGKMAELFERVSKVSTTKQRKVVAYIAEQFLKEYPSQAEFMNYDFCSDIIDSFNYMMREAQNKPTKKQLLYIKRIYPELTTKDLAMLSKEEATSLINLYTEKARIENEESRKAKDGQLKETYKDRLRNEWLEMETSRTKDREYDNPTPEQYFARLLQADGYTTEDIALILKRLQESQEMTL